jgi:hypothetical protein
MPKQTHAERVAGYHAAGQEALKALGVYKGYRPKSRRAAQGIEAEILLAQPKDWSGKPGFLFCGICAEIPQNKKCAIIHGMTGGFFRFIGH